VAAHVAEAEEDAALFSVHGFPEQDEAWSGDKHQAPTLFTAYANLDLDEPWARVFLST
jgi:protoheme ferro-lyase